MASLAALRIVDADSHVIEPADLWTSRVAHKHREAVPHVEVHPSTQHHHWVIGSTFIWPVGFFATAGTDVVPPATPWEFDEVDPGCFDAQARLKRLDEYGVSAQVLYPNIVGFQSQLVMELEPEIALLTIEVYNDFLSEFSQVDPERLLPIAMLPYWDRDASVREMQRCTSMGHRGVLFANKLEQVGLPPFFDSYWDPVYAAAQDLGMTINFHIGFAEAEWKEFLSEDAIARRRAAQSTAREQAMFAAKVLMQGDTLGPLLTTGLCERFPDLRFVAVESAFGWVPFYLEALDWHWKVFAADVSGRMLLPSEYFRRQCYGTFWFERTTLPLLEQYADNFMFSTDYPHATSLSPGPHSPAERAADHVAAAFADVDPTITSKVLSENASRLYNLTT